jgi:hypothetical protein
LGNAEAAASSARLAPAVSGAADMLHKCNAPLLVFLIQALGLFEFLLTSTSRS